MVTACSSEVGEHAERWYTWSLGCWNHCLTMSPPLTPGSLLLDKRILRALLSTRSSHKVQRWLPLLFKTFQLSFQIVFMQLPFSFILLSPISFPSTCSNVQHAFILSLLFSAYMFKLFPSRCISCSYWIATPPSDHWVCCQNNASFIKRAGHLNFILRFICLKTVDIQNAVNGEIASVTSKSPLFRSDAAFLL